MVFFYQFPCQVPSDEASSTEEVRRPPHDGGLTGYVCRCIGDIWRPFFTTCLCCSAVVDIFGLPAMSGGVSRSLTTMLDDVGLSFSCMLYGFFLDFVGFATN